MIRILLFGSSGKMGKTIMNAVNGSVDFEIVAGADAFISDKSMIFPVFNDINDCDIPSDVIIDFSTAAAVPEAVSYALSKKLPIVVCTTGLSEETICLINKAAETIPVFRSANMSIGINLISSLLKKCVKVLDEAGFDIEIIERHHNHKIDAPSGTALVLADAVNEACAGKFEYVYDRSNIKEKRGKNEIGIHSLRGGAIVGEHNVIFAGEGEIIELSHTALSKDVFAHGALMAAKFLVGKTPGLYGMEQIF